MSNTNTDTVTAEKLKAYIERIERLDEDKRETTANINEIYKEAKGEGFDVKVMKDIVKLRRASKAEREEYEQILDLYKAALGL